MKSTAYWRELSLGVSPRIDCFITSWNFPMMIAALKLAPALVMGNSVVLKPAEQSPLTALRIAELATEAGLPDGVLNVVPGSGELAGKSLALHMGVDAAPASFARSAGSGTRGCTIM